MGVSSLLEKFPNANYSVRIFKVDLSQYRTLLLGSTSQPTLIYLGCYFSRYEALNENRLKDTNEVIYNINGPTTKHYNTVQCHYESRQTKS